MKRPLVTAVALMATASAVALASPADAHDANYFSSCTALHKVFPHGVAKSATAASKQVRDGYGRPSVTKRAKKVYAENRSRLDRDHDGTACEA